jgi:hypothetical protein
MISTAAMTDGSSPPGAVAPAAGAEASNAWFDSNTPPPASAPPAALVAQGSAKIRPWERGHLARWFRRNAVWQIRIDAAEAAMIGSPARVLHKAMSTTASSSARQKTLHIADAELVGDSVRPHVTTLPDARTSSLLYPQSVVARREFNVKGLSI